MNRNLLHLRYRDASQKYLKFKSRIEKSKETGRFASLTKSRQRALILRLEKIWKRLLSLKIQLKMVAAGAAMGIGFVAPTFAQTAVGEEFVVNTYTDGFQKTPSIASDADGDFVVVWESKYQDGDQSGVYSQRFSKNGTTIGSEILVNTDTNSQQRYADVAMDDDGDYVVVWSHGYGDNSADGIHLQRFDSDGNKVGVEDTAVNTFQTSSQTRPAVAMDADGDFVVVWQSDQQDGENYGVFAQRFDRNGIKQGAEFQVNSETAYSQLAPDVAMDEDGDMVVVWQSYLQDGSDEGVFYRRFDKDGTPLDQDDVPVNIYTNNRQYDPAVGMDADGDFVIAWTSSGQEGSTEGEGIYFNRFTNQGVRLSSVDLHANITVANSQSEPAVAMDDDGDFTIVWSSYGQDDYDRGVFMQQFSRNCDPFTALDIQVSQFPGVGQVNPAISMDADGDLAIAFESGDKYSANQDGDASGIIGVHFEKVDPVITESEDRYANTTTASNQREPDVATDGVGNYVVVWQSEDETDDEFRGIFGQLFNKDSEPIGNQFHINQYTDENQDNPAVAMDIDGDFVVVWESYNEDTYYETVVARRFDKNANPVEDAFQVNDYFQQNQFRPDVAIDANGNFVIAWESFGQDTDGAGIYAKLFDKERNELKGEWLVNTSIVGSQSQPTVAMDEDGEFAIAWSGYTPDEEDHIFVSLFDAAGEEKLAEQQVSISGYNNSEPSIAMDADGDFAVVWSSYESKYYDVYVRKYDKSGTALSTTETLVNTFQSGHSEPSIAMDGDGDFVVLWSEQDKYSQGPDGYSVYGRRFDKNVTALDNGEIIHKVTSGNQMEPAAAMDRTGDLVYTWASEFMDGDGYAVVHKSIELEKFPGIEISATGTNTVVNEDGTTDELEVKLTDFPCDTVYLTFQGDSDIDWGNGFDTELVLGLMDTTTQTIVVEMKDDLIDEDDIDVSFSPEIASVDPSFDTLTVQNFIIRQGDNDNAEVISIPGIPNQLTEGEGTLPYQFALGTIPTDTVKVTISEATLNTNLDLGGGPGSSFELVFPPDITALDTVDIQLSSPDDPIIESDISLALTVSSSSLDDKYNTLNDQVLSPLTILDNDSAVVIFNQTDGSTGVVEGGISDTVTFALSAIPTSEVTLVANIGNQLDLGAGQGQPINLVFSPDSSALETQKLGISAFDDFDGELEHFDTLTYSVTSVDTDFNGLTVANTPVTIGDNDGQGLTIVESNAETRIFENGVTDTISISLNTISNELVQVIATPVPGIDLGNGDGISDTLFYPSGTPTTDAFEFVLTAVDDDFAQGDRSELLNLNFESVDIGYDTLTIAPVSVAIEDDDLVGFIVTPTDGTTSVEEGGPSDSILIQLTSVPFDTVKITLAASDQLDFGTGANNSGELTFAPDATSMTGQFLTFSAIDDLLVEEDATEIISAVVNSEDAGYDGLSLILPDVDVIDNDSASVHVVETNGATIISEAGDSDTIYVSLTGVPSDTVFVTITPDEGIDIGFGPGVPVEYAFAPGAALDLQLVVLSAEDNVIPNGGLTGDISFELRSNDPLFDAVPIEPIAIDIIDNDSPGLVIIESGGDTQLIEGEAGENYTVRLATVPDDTVKVNIMPHADLSIGNGFGQNIELTFLPDETALENQVVSIESQDNNLIQANLSLEIVHIVSSDDLGYDVLLNDTLHVVVEEDDDAEVIITLSDGANNVEEGGLTDSYQVSLTSIPSAILSITIAGLEDVDLGSGPGQEHVLTFDPEETALIAQTVTITAVDDDLIEGEESHVLTHIISTTDPFYVSASVNDVSVTIVDNDLDVIPDIVIPNLLVDNTDQLNEGDSSFYSVSLTTIPTDTVFITIYPGNHLSVGGEWFGEERQIKFAPDSTALDPILIYVEAEDDFVDYADQKCPIDHYSTSTDIVYDNIEQTISLTIIDNDSPETLEPRDVVVYQAISPNGDRIHDILKINYLFDYEFNRVSVFNLQGVEVFSLDNYNNRDRFWDAIGVPDGTYVVSVFLRDFSGNTKTSRSFVVVKSNYDN